MINKGVSLYEGKRIRAMKGQKAINFSDKKSLVNTLHIHHCSSKLTSGPAPCKTGDISNHSTTQYSRKESINRPKRTRTAATNYKETGLHVLN